jgi:hypothetical protein
MYLFLNQQAKVIYHSKNCSLGICAEAFLTFYRLYWNTITVGSLRNGCLVTGIFLIKQDLHFINLNIFLIHATTRSATSIPLSKRLVFRNFNPRTHKECDVSPDVKNNNIIIFQSTHSQGVRQLFVFFS